MNFYLDSVRYFISDVFDHEALEKNLKDCEFADGEDVPTCYEDLLDVARAKINVFPFSSVKQCWFNLYADGSLKRCERLLGKAGQLMEKDKRDEAEQALTDAVAALDYALIVAGGGDQQRQDLIHDVFEYLDMELYPEESGRPIKRARLSDNISSRTRHVQSRSPFSTSLGPVPTIEHFVSMIDKPSLSFFCSWAMGREQPLILGKILDHWPALTEWTYLDYWLRVTLGGRRLVPVEIGQSYHDEDWKQEMMPFKDFVKKYIPLEGDEAEGETGYLAQHDLFKQIKQLRSDVVKPDYCYTDIEGAKDDIDGVGVDDLDGTSEDFLMPEIHQNIWFGGRTVSPLHHDPYHNILCQVHGAKYIRLYSPEHTSQLYPRSYQEPAPHLRSKATGGKTDSGHEGAQQETIDMSNNSSVDVYAMQLSPDEDWDEKWPGISKVPYLECVLEAGEALYIPKGWWHYVRGSSATGISVSFWW